MIRFKAFRAINDQVSAQRYIDGHEKVLKSYNAPKITSANHDWVKDPNVYAILVEHDEVGLPIGGARIHVSDKNKPLPIEEAIGESDSQIYDLIRNNNKRVGELCGVWNAKEVSGKGLSSLLIRASVAKAGVVVANQLKLDELYGLCAPWTLELVKKVGFVVVEKIGDKGNIPYPKPDLPATVVVVEDTETLQFAINSERESIVSLRKQPKQKKKEVSNQDELEIEYDLYINNLDEIS